MNKRILIFVDSFLPGYKAGGPTYSIVNLVRLISDEFVVFIATRNHDTLDTKEYTNVEFDKVTKHEEFNVIYLSKINRKSIHKVIKEINPDLIYLNSFFSKITQLVTLVNKSVFHKKIILAPRGELQENTLQIKWQKKSIYVFVYKLFKIYKGIYFHATAKIEAEQIKKLFSINKVVEIQNTVFLKPFTPLQKQQNELKLIFISRISEKKNLDFALNLLSKTSVNVCFDIYGPKEDLVYWKKCEQIINKLPKNIKTTYLGSIKHDIIYDVMRKYNAFFFPTKSENFGHVIVEAMQSGIIPIISDQTPWRDLETQNIGWDISLNNEKKYIEVIEKLYYMSGKEFNILSYNTINFVNKNLNTNELREMYINYFNSL